MTILNLLHTAFSCIAYGFIATVALMTIIYFLLREYNKNIVRTLPFFITGTVLAILLTVQSSLLIGAASAKNTVDAAEIYLTQMFENEYGTISTKDSQAILDKITTEFPIIGTYVGICDFGGNDVSDLPAVMADTMRDYLNSYIWHRVWWILGFTAVALIVVLIVPGTGKGGNLKPTSSTGDDFESSIGDVNEWGL